MTDFLESLRKQIADRMSSPIFGSFIIAWLCWNHHYFFILFSSDLTVEYRFILAKNTLYPDGWALLFRAFIFPALSSLAYIVLYPKLSKPLLLHWDEQQTILEGLRNKAQLKRLLTEEESQKITLDAIEQRARFQGTVESLEREIATLRTALEASRKVAAPAPAPAPTKAKAPEDKVTGDTLKSAIGPVLPLEHLNPKAKQDALDSLDPDTKEGVRSLLRLIAKMGGGTDDVERMKVHAGLGVPTIKAQYLFDRAIDSGLVESTNTVWAHLSKKGRAYVIENGLTS